MLTKRNASGTAGMSAKKQASRELVSELVGEPVVEASIEPVGKIEEDSLLAVLLNRDPSDLLEESIVKLFNEAFDIDIKTCTKEEWAERITIKGGTLKQWQSFIKVTKDGEERHHE